MSDPRPRARLHGCLRAFPAAALELTPAGVVVDSNGRLEQVLGAGVIGRPFAELLDDTSRAKWERLLAGGRDGTPHVLWELVLRHGDILDLRTFTAVWGEDDDADTLWLVEYSRDAKLEALYEELSEANAELVGTQRELAKERSRLARVLAEEAAARAAAERATSRLGTLHALSASVRATQTQEEAARHLLAGARAALEVDTALLLLLGEPTAMLEVYAAAGIPLDLVDGGRLRVGEGLAGTVAATRRPLVVPDTLRSELGPALLSPSIRALVATPLLVGERLIGVLAITAGQPRSFPAEDVQLLELVGRDLAAALERTRLLEGERAARADAERAVRLRDEVLAVVAHDLRNPIGLISSAAALLADETLEPEARHQMLDVLRRGADVMNRLVRDLLDVASIEAGRLAIERRPTALGPLVRDACEMFRRRAADRDVDLDCRADDAPDAVLADHSRLLQVVGNLLDNAIRLTPAGGRIVVAAERTEGAAQLTVSDTGPGIAAEELPHLFDRFWQGVRSRRGSTGLGLAIAKGIVEAHGGRIRADSVPGEGTTFVISLPQGTPPA